MLLMVKLNVLITGCEGFIGSHLAESMLRNGSNVYGTIFGDTQNIDHIINDMNVMKIDMKNKEEVENAVKISKPDLVFHLAAQSFVIPSWEDPEKTLMTNIFGTLHLFDAVKKLSPDAVIEVACSSAEYGFVNSEEVPIKESNPFRPSSPYAISKIGQDMFSYLYWRAYNMKIIRTRLFNITGPRKTFDVCSDFAKGVAEIEAGKKSALTVGNLDAMRDITDVRDAVKAIELLTQKGVHGDVYNVCSGKAHKVAEILEKLISMTNREIKVVRSPDARRKIDDPLFLGDNSKIGKLGWKPEIPIDKTLSDMLDYWRKVIK